MLSQVSSTGQLVQGYKKRTHETPTLSPSTAQATEIDDDEELQELSILPILFKNQICFFLKITSLFHLFTTVALVL